MKKKGTNFKQILVFLLILVLNSQLVHAQFNADFFPEFTAYAGNPIIRYGDGFENAAWNDPSVIKVGNQYIMYTTAADGIFLSESNEVKVYRQISNDGINWTLNPTTPILEPLNGTYYDGGTETPSVLIKDGVYHMYTTCYPPGNDPSTYVIAHAVSTDGISWTMDSQPILESNLTDIFYSEIVAEPGAIVYNDSIYVYFTAAGIVNGSPMQGIGCIKSADGSNFGNPALAFSLPTDVYETSDYWGLSTPAALAINDSIYVFTDVAQTVNGNWLQVALHQFKTDGTSGVWLHDSDPIHHMQDFTWTDGNYLSNLLAPSPLLEEDGTLRIWYAGHNVADIVGSDTTYNVVIDPFGMIQVLPEYYGIGTSSYQFPQLNTNFLVNDEPFMQIFPNPTEGNLTVTLQNVEAESVIFVTNALGKVVKEHQVTDEKSTDLNMEDLENGIYYVELKSGLNSNTVKIVLMK